MLHRLKSEPLKNGIESTIIVKEDYEYGGDDNAVQKIGDNEYSLKNIQSSEFSVYHYSKEECENKLGYRHKEIPAAVFEHRDIFGICKYFPIVSEPYELKISEALPVGKAHYEVADDGNIGEYYQMD